jgi:hypothetical protein
MVPLWCHKGHARRETAVVAKKGKLIVDVAPEILERLDRLRDRERQARPGLLLSRADIVRELLLAALAKKDGEVPA